ncbi:MAG: flavodoxin family protein [Eubacteriales bacterium]|nr:flavodoxin family protein [Eubacteriales bacterium]
MKIVVLNGSPRKGGNTEVMIKAFAEASSKNEVMILNVASMNIRGCLGCQYCYEHQGECVQKDDMAKIFEVLKDADMVVFASPIYWFDISAQLKTVIDRLYACGSTGFHFHKTALLLDAGADHVFEAAIAQYKAMSSYLNWEDMGIITIPNMTQKGSMKDCPKLSEVIALGKRL